MLKKISIDKWANILVILNIKDNPPITKINEKVNLTYSHTHNIIKEMEYLGWLTTFMDGRERRINLTKKGEFIKNKLIPILEEIRQ